MTYCKNSRAGEVQWGWDSWTEFFGGFFGGIFPHEKCQVGEVFCFVEPGFGLFFGMTPGLLMEFFYPCEMSVGGSKLVFDYDD